MHRATHRERVRTAVARRFAVDPRALAALRIALGLLLLADLALRARAFSAHYTDAGVLPRSALRDAYGPLADLSLHALTAGPYLQVALFVVAGLAALALAAGYRTRLAAVVSWLLLVSLHARNPLVLNAGDSVLRRLLFWGLFLPLGGVRSVDAVRRRLDGATATRADGDGSAPSTLTRLASAALLVQVVLVYALNAVLKLRGEAWLDGTAVRYVFGLDHLTVLLGDALVGHPLVLEWLAHAWLALLLASPLLLVLTGWPRALLAGAFAAGHLGMLLTLRLGVFPLVSVAALLPFLPPRVWDAAERVGRRVGPTRRERWREWVTALARRLPDGPGLPADARRTGRRVATVVVAVLLVAVLCWNAVSVGAAPAPDTVREASEEYRWDMFAPEPRRVDGWYVAPATLESGARVDAWNGGPVSWERPRDTASTFPTHRWLVYLLDLQRPGGRGLRDEFAGHLCRRWNAAHDDRMTEVSVTYVAQPVRLDAPDPTRRVDLGTYRCPAG